MSQRTLIALVRRGFDLETASRLASTGHTLKLLKSLDESALRALDISEDMVSAIFREPRPPIPLETLGKVLYESRMTCCVCRDRNRGVIVHHIHEFSDTRSHDESNLVVLCLDHHGEAHTRRALQMNLTANRLRDLKSRWLADVREHDIHEALSAKSNYSHEAVRQISDAVQYMVTFHTTPNAPKFSLSAEEMHDGRVSRLLLEETSGAVIWRLIHFPEDGYSSQSIAANESLIISNFGGSNLLFYEFDEQRFTSASLDSYEAGNLTLLSERKRFGDSPVLRKYPPGDLLLVGEKLYVGQIFSEFLVVMDLRSRTVIKRLPVGGDGELAYCHKNERVYFASNSSGRLAIVNPVSYQIELVPYPEPSLHIGSMFCHPDTGLVYLGLHRTSNFANDWRSGKQPDKPNSFVAVYDPVASTYHCQIELAVDTDDMLERCWPSSMLYDADKDLLFIGMLGSPKNIYLVDAHNNEIVNFMETSPNTRNRHDCVDSLSLAFYQRHLLSINRANYELAVIEREALEPVLSIPLHGVTNGPSDITVYNDQAYVSHSEYAGILEVNLQQLIQLIPDQPY